MPAKELVLSKDRQTDRQTHSQTNRERERKDLNQLTLETNRGSHMDNNEIQRLMREDLPVSELTGWLNS